MKWFFTTLTLLYSLNAMAQIDLEVYTHADSLTCRYPISVYSSPCEYVMELPSKVDDEIFYLVKIVEKSGNFFRVERISPDDHVYGFSGWVHRGDVYTTIQNYAGITITLYTNPHDRVPTGIYIDYPGCVGAVYDIEGNYVLVKIVVKEEDVWGWVHRCHLNSSPYTSDCSLHHLEY